MTLRREDLDGGIAVLTIDRPEARNALSPETRSEIAASFEAMAADDAVRAVVLTGAGEHFCAGGDVKTMGSREPSAMEDRVAVMVRVAELLITFPKPLVAAVRGHAAGAGASIACLADVVVAADSAKFTVSFLNIGLVPDWGLTHTLQRRVGPAAGPGPPPPGRGGPDRRRPAVSPSPASGSTRTRRTVSGSPTCARRTAR